MLTVWFCKTYETRTEDVYSETKISALTQKILFVLFACRNIWEAGNGVARPGCLAFEYIEDEFADGIDLICIGQLQ